MVIRTVNISFAPMKQLICLNQQHLYILLMKHTQFYYSLKCWKNSPICLPFLQWFVMWRSGLALVAKQWVWVPAGMRPCRLLLSRPHIHPEHLIQSSARHQGIHSVIHSFIPTFPLSVSSIGSSHPYVDLCTSLQEPQNRRVSVLLTQGEPPPLQQSLKHLLHQAQLVLLQRYWILVMNEKRWGRFDRDLLSRPEGRSAGSWCSMNKTWRDSVCLIEVNFLYPRLIHVANVSWIDDSYIISNSLFLYCETSTDQMSFFAGFDTPVQIQSYPW